MRIFGVLVLAGCGASASHATFPVPASITTLAADSCGQFELVADKGTDRARAAVDVRARCDNSYICSPRVASNRIELHGVGPGTTTLHLEYADPNGGAPHQADVAVTVVAPTSKPHSSFGTVGCSYIPVH